jgi:hypothetical protein
MDDQSLWLALGVLVVAAIWDLWKRQIPNTLSILLLLLAVTAWAVGWQDIAWYSLALGLVLGLLVGFVGFVLGMLGGGVGHWGADRVSAQRALEGAFAPLVPRNFRPLTSGRRMTLIRPDHDLIVGPGPIDELSAAWDTELWRYPHGHITLMNAPGVPARVCERLVHPGFLDREGLRLAG